MAVLEAEFESKTLQRVAVTLLLCMLCATAFADTLVTNGGVTLDTSDLVYAMPDSGSLRRRIERQNGLYTLDVGAQNGLGSRNYRLVVIGE
jgi:hypothetical protein